MSKPNTPTFRDLKSSFETRSKPTTATNTSSTSSYRYRSEAGDLANMPTEKPARTVPAIAQTIDSVLETPAAKQPVRPLAKLRPSWIGPPPPDRPRTPGKAPAMKQHVNVEYSSPGLQPPVYICTNLSDPQWEPVEMLAEKREGGVFRFCKAFAVEEGEYQYKFRLGPGDWWACDESRPTVDDGMGNKNNLLAVKAQEVKPPHLKAEEKESKSAIPAPAPKPPAMIIPEQDLPSQPAITPAPQLKADEKDSKSVSPAPAPKPPAVIVPEQHPSPQTATTPTPHDSAVQTPLPKHEAFIPNKVSESQQTPDREVKEPLATELSPDDVDSEDEMTNSPLMRHESVSPHSVEQEHAPLFRHESIALGYNHHEPAATTISSAKPPPKTRSPPHVHYKGDVTNRSLEHFPTDHAGIMEKIHRASISLPEDETMNDNDVLKSPHPQALSDTSMSPPSLPSVQEADEELERIRQAEEEEYENEEESGEEMDPLREVESEPEDEVFEPKVAIEVIEIDRVIVVEMAEEKKSRIESMMEKAGGRNNVVAIAIGVVVAAVGIVIAARYL